MVFSLKPEIRKHFPVIKQESICVSSMCYIVFVTLLICVNFNKCDINCDNLKDIFIFAKKRLAENFNLWYLLDTFSFCRISISIFFLLLIPFFYMMFCAVWQFVNVYFFESVFACSLYSSCRHLSRPPYFNTKSNYNKFW